METQMDPAEMRTNAAQAAALLKSMANESRLMILCELTSGEKSVGQLLDTISLNQSALSQHLAILRREKLVTTNRRAQSIYYSLASDEVRSIMATLYELYCAGSDSDDCPATQPAQAVST